MPVPLPLLLDDVIPFSVIFQRHKDGWGPGADAIKKFTPSLGIHD